MSEQARQDHDLARGRASRRRFLAMAAATVAVAAGCAPAPPAPTPAPKPGPGSTPPAPAPAPKPAPQAPAVAPKTDRQIVVSIWSGEMAEAARKLVVPRFEKETGAKVVLDEGTAAVRLNKLRAQKSNPETDVFFALIQNVYVGIKEDLFEKIDPANIPNMKKLYDWALQVPNYGPGYRVVGMGFAYHPEKVKNPPKQWADLWDDRFRGQVGIFNFPHSQGPALLIRAAELSGGSMQNVEPGFSKLATLKPAKVYGFRNDGIQLFNQGAIALYPEYNYYIQSDIDRGLPIRFAVPDDGLFLDLDLLNVVKGTKNKALAEQFINLFLDAEVQAGLAKDIYVSPANKETKVDAALGRRLIDADTAAKGRFYDPKLMAEQRPRWQERFNGEVLPKW